MTYTNAVAVVMVEANKLIDKLELETSIPKSDRNFLAAYQTKLTSASTRKDEDLHFLDVFSVWMIQRHRITA